MGGRFERLHQSDTQVGVDSITSGLDRIASPGGFGKFASITDRGNHAFFGCVTMFIGASISDVDIRQACMHVIQDGVAEASGHSPADLVGVGLEAGFGTGVTIRFGIGQIVTNSFEGRVTFDGISEALRGAARAAFTRAAGHDLAEVRLQVGREVAESLAAAESAARRWQTLRGAALPHPEWRRGTLHTLVLAALSLYFVPFYDWWIRFPSSLYLAVNMLAMSVTGIWGWKV